MADDGSTKQEMKADIDYKAAVKAAAAAPQRSSNHRTARTGHPRASSSSGGASMRVNCTHSPLVAC